MLLQARLPTRTRLYSGSPLPLVHRELSCLTRGPPLLCAWISSPLATSWT